MIVRPETASDIAAIGNVIHQAFGSRNEACEEADLVNRLRRDNELVLSLVAEEDGQLVGHVGFSRLWIVQDARRIPGISLAPLAVMPDRQRNGVGRTLVEAGHARLRDAGETIVFVLGDQDYYGRLGFSLSAAAAFDCRYAGPHFQALRLASSAPDAGSVEYAPAFNGLG
ncbi:MAG: N-acetyltransferase [Afipia sp.]|nr:N-acetyltransferase [Afipia sp.]